MNSPRAVWVAAGGLVLLGLAIALWLVGSRPLLPDEDASAPVPGEVATLARLQADFGNVVAGRGLRPAETAPDRLELLADALQALLSGHPAKAGGLLDAVESEIARRLPSERDIADDPALAAKSEWLVAYFELLPAPPKPGKHKLDTAAWVRFAIVMRKVDAVLLSGILPELSGYDLVVRKSGGPPAGTWDGIWLRLPCKVAAGRRAVLDVAAKRLKQLAGPLTDCPLPDGREADFALAEKLARAAAAAR
ncbi:MAG: ankyrin repeat domain-containing protein [Magnetospirillum sp.]|nr:ankyrin repeat domain-containing protein [Magnetospirillum sp.]